MPCCTTATFLYGRFAILSNGFCPDQQENLLELAVFECDYVKTRHFYHIGMS